MNSDQPATEDGVAVGTKSGWARLEEPTRLSESVFWDLPNARSGPERAFSYAFLARAAARAVQAFFQETTQDGDEPLRVVEFGADSGRFAWAFLRAWASFRGAPAVRYTLASQDRSVCEARRRRSRLLELIEEDRLEVICGDFEKKEIQEIVGLGTCAVIVNDAFSGIRQDAFAVFEGRLHECLWTLDAPVGAAAAQDGSAASVPREDVRLGLEHRPVDLPYYDDEVFDGLLEEYRRELVTGRFLLPVEALRFVRRLANSAEEGALLLHAGRGPVDLEDLVGAAFPRPLRSSGGVALPVDFHALARQVEALGGRVFQSQAATPELVVAAALLHVDAEIPVVRERLDEWVGSRGPSATPALVRPFTEGLAAASFKGVLTFLDLTAWDPSIARLVLPRLQDLAQSGLRAKERAALDEAIRRIWDAYLHIDEPVDLAHELAIVLLAADLHSSAMIFLHRSLELYGEHTATHYNLGWALLQTGEPELAREHLERSLELDPENQGAFDLLRGIGDSPIVAEAPVLPAVPSAVVVKEASSEVSAYVSNLEHLRGEAALLNLRLRAEVERWRAAHAPGAGLEELTGARLTHLGADIALDSLTRELFETEPSDPFSSLESQKALHCRREAKALQAGVALRLPELARCFGLDEFERGVLLLALAPELDERYERVFGYLNHDMQRRRPTVRLALRLFTTSPEQRNAESWKLDEQGVLRICRLLRIADFENSFSGAVRARGLCLEARTLAFLLDRPRIGDADPALSSYLTRHERPPSGVALGRKIIDLQDYLSTRPDPPPVISLDGPDALLLRRAASAATGADLLVLQGSAVADATDPADLIARTLREVEIEKRPLLIENAAALRREGRPALALDMLLQRPCSQPRILAAVEPWLLPETTRTTPMLSVHVPAPDQPLRKELWREALENLVEETDLGELAGRFQLRSLQIERAAHRLRAHLRSRPDETGKIAPILYSACRAQCFVSLDALAERLESIHEWDDLIVPRSVKAKLRSIENWLRFRHVVHTEWGFAERVQAGRGMAALFSGSSGTGKTMAAGILGHVLDLDLYRIDLSAVASKYIGETEKNLAKIFDAAQAANAILFFDEADALFGKRSEVKDAHDRHANIEVSYLLQRMESYDGIAILATNIKSNLDVAFMRRLQVTVEFPFPGAADRERIWRRLFPEQVPQARDVDLSFLAKQFGLSGGSIKNCAMGAALAAAADRRSVEMRDLISAVAAEYDKLGKPVSQAAFGAWAQIVA